MSGYRKIAALGSSYAAGPGIDPIIDRAARRSGNNYPHLLARTLDAELTDLTVSGATTSTILDTPQRVGLTKFAPQIDGVPADADLVLVTAGGNDLGYIGSAILLGLRHTADRLLGGRLQRRWPAEMPEVTAQQRDTAIAGLSRIVTESRRRAPSARVVLVDYLPMLGPATVPGRDVPFDAAAVDALAAVHRDLVGVFAEAARHSGADLLPASRLGLGHELGTASPWIYPFRVARLVRSFHPNAAAMRAIALELAGP